MKKLIFLPIVFISLISFITCDKKSVDVGKAPFLSDLSAPDSILRDSTVVGYIFISADDPEGPENIDSVYFQVTKPDGSTNGWLFRMYDNGQAGDSVSGDGRYFYLLTTSPANQLGTYTFTFGARDKEGNVSNHPQANITMY